MSRTIPHVSDRANNLLPTNVEGIDSWRQLALDGHWAWNHATDGLWRTLDPVLGTSLRILGLLQTVSRRRTRARAGQSASAVTLTTGCDPSARRRGVPHGSNKSIDKHH